VLGESYRSSRKEGKRRDDVRERIEGLEEEVKMLRGVLSGEGEEGAGWIRGLKEMGERYVFLTFSCLAVEECSLL
jgi:hypothetical protein